MDSSLPGSSVHGIFQARILEWVAISFSNWHWEGVYTGTFGKKKTRNIAETFLQSSGGSWGWVGWGGESPKGLVRCAFSLSLLLSREDSYPVCLDKHQVCPFYPETLLSRRVQPARSLEGIRLPWEVEGAGRRGWTAFTNSAPWPLLSIQWICDGKEWFWDLVASEVFWVRLNFMDEAL